jgi:quercetin dioxygenase-like cupin family protein
MKAKSTNFLISAELPRENPAPGLTRQIMGYDGHIMMVKIRFEKGSVGYMHEHFHSQCTYVAAGQFEVMIGGEKKILETGDGFYVEPDVAHGVVCLEEGMLIDVFSPVRLDFLK